MKVSVVIGFKDWGANRIRMAGRSVLESAGAHECELIISDYGSAETTAVRQVAHELGAQYIYTPDVDIWSRSRALNAGFTVATGELFASTDADMLFSPHSFETIADYAERDPFAALFLQCRDLPKGMDDMRLSRQGIDWECLERESRLRPRWGMGGMMAISAEGYRAIRGFDERMHTYGGEDIDFAQRAARAGYKTVWVEDPRVRMYHMWHPDSKVATARSKAGAAAVAANVRIVKSDLSCVRNVARWDFAPADRDPLVSIAIVTRNRSAYLRETLQSCLAQTVQDFEVVIVDDGSTDDTRDAVASFQDPRFRYFWQENAGISVARNRALDESRGTYTAVLDDDDLMHPRRLEWQVQSLRGGDAGSTGSFVNFDDETGEMQWHFAAEASVGMTARSGHANGHGTWLVRTSILRQFRYDERITSAVDNNLMLRMIHSGLRFSLVQQPILFRRVHASQVTAVDATNQKTAAVQSKKFFDFMFSDATRASFAELWEARRAQPPMDADSVLAYLPDHLVRRRVRVVSTQTRLADLTLDGSLEPAKVLRDGGVTDGAFFVTDATYADLAQLSQKGVSWEATAAWRYGDSAFEADEMPYTDAEVDWLLLRELQEYSAAAARKGDWRIVVQEGHEMPVARRAPVSTRSLQIGASEARNYRLSLFSGERQAIRALHDTPTAKFIYRAAEV